MIGTLLRVLLIGRVSKLVPNLLNLLNRRCWDALIDLSASSSSLAAREMDSTRWYVLAYNIYMID